MMASGKTGNNAQPVAEQDSGRSRVDYPPYRISKNQKKIYNTMAEIAALNEHKRKPWEPSGVLK